jgi:hypothetical protein
VRIKVEGLLQQLSDVEGEQSNAVVNYALLESGKRALEGSNSIWEEFGQAGMAATLDTPVDYSALLLSEMASFVKHAPEDNRTRVLMASPGIDGLLQPDGLLDALKLIAEGGEVGGSIAILASKGAVGLGTLSRRLV